MTSNDWLIRDMKDAITMTQKSDAKEMQENADFDRGFIVKDSGKRQSFAGGMVRDTADGKIDWWRVRVGPMMRRWADHLTKGNIKYPDVSPGVPNWTLADGAEEMERFRQSADRHFAQWFNGENDEDHAAAVMFNINGFEYVKAKAK